MKVIFLLGLVWNKKLFLYLVDDIWTSFTIQRMNCDIWAEVSIRRFAYQQQQDTANREQ